MKICYQVATPDIRKSPLVTAYQGDMEEGFKRLRDLGYDGAELMIKDPALLDKEKIISMAERNNMIIPLLCTGEVFGQDKLSFMDRNSEVREQAIKRTKDIIDFASLLNAQVNIGRLRGQFEVDIPREVSYGWAIDAFKEAAEHGEKRNVIVALEPVNILQGNFINSTQDGMKIVDEVGSKNLRIMLDVFHMHMEDKDISQSIMESKGYASYVHLTDSNRRYPGHCKLDFYKIIKCLYEIGYDYAAGVEVFQIPDQDTAMEQSIKHIKPIVEEMEKLYK